MKLSTLTFPQGLRELNALITLIENVDFYREQMSKLEAATADLNTKIENLSIGNDLEAAKATITSEKASFGAYEKEVRDELEDLKAFLDRRAKTLSDKERAYQDKVKRLEKRESELEKEYADLSATTASQNEVHIQAMKEAGNLHKVAQALKDEYDEKIAKLKESLAAG